MLGVALARVDETTRVWLTQREGPKDIVRAELVLDAPAKQVAWAECTAPAGLNQGPSGTLIGLASDAARCDTKPLKLDRAWRIDPHAREFIEVPPEGLHCRDWQCDTEDSALGSSATP